MTVFISFSSADKKIAEKIYNRLKKNGIDCWICTKDIPPGADYQACIVEAIEKSDIVLLVFSSQANSSSEIAKELSLASKKVLIPARIEDVIPQGSFQYQLSNRQFVDLFEDFDNKLEELSNRIKTVIDNGVNSPRLPHRSKNNRLTITVASVASAAILAAGGWFVLKPGGSAQANDPGVIASSAKSVSAGIAPPVPSATLTRTESKPATAAESLPQRADAVLVKPEEKAERAVKLTSPVPATVEKTSVRNNTEAVVSDPVKILLSEFGTSTTHQRLSLLRTADAKLPNDLNYREAEALLNGLGAQRPEGVALTAPHLGANLGGDEIVPILGDAQTHGRLSELRALSNAGKIKKDLQASEAKVVLNGIGAQHAEAVAILAPYLAGSLGGSQMSEILGDSQTHSRLSEIRALANTMKIKKGLRAEEAKAVLDGTGAQRDEAIAQLAPYLVGNLNGNEMVTVLGDTSTHSRLAGIRSLVGNGKVMPELPSEDAQAVLAGSGAQREQAIGVLAQNFIGDMGGKEGSLVLGDTSTHARLAAMRSLVNAGKVKNGLRAEEGNAYLEGTGAQRASAVSLLAKNFTASLDGKDVALILGDTTSHSRISALKSLADAGKIKKGLARSDLTLVLQKLDGSEPQGQEILTPFLAR